MMKRFYIWNVKEEEYKLRLDAESIIELEENLGMSLLNVLNNDIPKLGVMLQIVHSAIKKYNANIKRTDVNVLYNDYIEDGNSQLEFFSEVIMGIFKVSGFFTQAQVEKMEKEMKKIK